MATVCVSTIHSQDNSVRLCISSKDSLNYLGHYADLLPPKISSDNRLISHPIVIKADRPDEDCHVSEIQHNLTDSSSTLMTEQLPPTP